MSKHFLHGLKIIHINAQSLYQHLDDLRCDLQNKIPDVVMVSETWLKSWHNDSMLHIEGYRILRNDRRDQKRGGGVAIYLRKDLKYSIISKSSYCEGFCEFIITEVTKDFNKILIACVYNPHKTHSIFNFFDVLNPFTAKYKEIVTGGDFNLNLLDFSDGKVSEFKSLINSVGLCVVNSSNPTHFQGTPSLLDVFLVSNIPQVLRYQQLSAPSYSHHDLMFLLYNIPCSRSEKHEITFRDFRKINVDALFSDVLNIQWMDGLMLSLDECVCFMENNIVSLFDKHVPVLSKRCNPKSNPWMTKEIMIM